MCSGAASPLTPCPRVLAPARQYYNISKHLRFPDLPPELSGPAGGIPPYFVLNVLLPEFAPGGGSSVADHRLVCRTHPPPPPCVSPHSFPPNNPLWGGTREDGEGFRCAPGQMPPPRLRALLFHTPHFPSPFTFASACVYFLMKPETRRALLSGEALSPSIALLKEFIARDELRDRFKVCCFSLKGTPCLSSLCCSADEARVPTRPFPIHQLQAMATVLNIEQLDLGFALKRLLQEYSRPILTRPQHAFSSDGNTYFEATVDTFAFAYIGRRGWDLVKCVSAGRRRALPATPLSHPSPVCGFSPGPRSRTLSSILVSPSRFAGARAPSPKRRTMLRSSDSAPAPTTSQPHSSL